MANPAFRLECAWQPVDNDPSGCLIFTLINLSDEILRDFKLSYTSTTRAKNTSEPRCENAIFLKKEASLHQYAPPKDFALQPGGCWQFTVSNLWRPARHRTDGAKSAYVTRANGTHATATVDDTFLSGRPAMPEPVLMPQGEVTEPFSLLPWPALIELQAGEVVPVALYPTEGTGLEALRAMQSVASLYRRLFAAAPTPFALTQVHEGRELRFEVNDQLSPAAYTLDFGKQILLTFGDAAGCQYGLTALAQLMHGARVRPETFKFPAAGKITDSPRYGWRGCHLDVARQFYPATDVTRLIDIMAWMRMNVFHWHLSDDEAWRLEIKAYPALTSIGATRGPDEPMLPQLGNAAETAEGFYTQDDVKAIVAHATAYNIEVIPEIDIPGHSAATLTALPDLVDGQEAPDSYRSVQGFPNNALNPAMPLTYEFLGNVFDEITSLFPFEFVHLGGDEVADETWMASPRAKALMQQEGIEGTFGLQSYFMKRVQVMLMERGKKLAGWNEVAHGGGVNPDGTLLMAWQKPEIGVELALDGYDVVMTPGQAYYLDMVQDEAFQEPGASWAGTVPPKHTYMYEAVGEFPTELAARMRGVQACIWSEHILNKDYFNRLVFPRLSAVAEAAWTPKGNKNWLRFAAISPLIPQL